MTGWGQDGPYAQAAGHDINYIALAGALAHFGRAGSKPTPPINLVGDFGGGGMLMAFGIACGLVESGRSGKGQVIDAAMVDGSAALMAMIWGFKALGIWGDFGTNVLDTGAPFYDTYETADGKFISLGSLEPQFYAELITRIGLADEVDLARQMDNTTYPELAGALHRAVQDEDARRVVRDPRAHRRVLRAGAHDDRGRRPPAHQGPQHGGERVRARPAGARRRASAGRRARSSVRRPGRVSTPTRCSPTGASRPPTWRSSARRERSSSREPAARRDPAGRVRHVP